jgi:hypothetical protein
VLVLIAGIVRLRTFLGLAPTSWVLLFGVAHEVFKLGPESFDGAEFIANLGLSVR